MITDNWTGSTGIGFNIAFRDQLLGRADQLNIPASAGVGPNAGFFRIDARKRETGPGFLDNRSGINETSTGRPATSLGTTVDFRRSATSFPLPAYRRTPCAS